MAISDYKITESEIQENDMYNAKNQWVNEATDLKNKFDALPKKTIEKYNQLIDAMEGENGYLPKSGGTMTGELFGQNISPSSNNTYNLGSQTFTWADAYINEIYTNYVAGNNDTLYTKGNLRTLSGYDGLYNLGNSDARWKNIYAVNGTIQTSDEREKNSITPLDKEKASMFIMGVNPVSYKFNDGTSGRTHCGMISQHIEKLMESLGMDSKDFAGFIKSPKTKQVETGKDENGNPVYEDKVIEGEYTYGLRYTEFIAPMIATIQYQQQKIEEQGKQIEDLTKRVEALEGEK